MKELRASLKKAEEDLGKAHTSRLVLNPCAHSSEHNVLSSRLKSEKERKSVKDINLELQRKVRIPSFKKICSIKKFFFFWGGGVNSFSYLHSPFYETFSWHCRIPDFMYTLRCTYANLLPQM